MSLLKKKKRAKLGKKKSADKFKKKKQSMSFAEFKQSFNSLDTNNYGSWPWVVKATLILGMLLLIAFITYMVPVKKKMGQIESAEREEKSLLETYREKESKARHLDEYKNQIAQMEIEFNSLLEQLPKETRVSELVKGINMTGLGSGIRFKKITVKPELQQEYFIEQPIQIEANGGYHQFGEFISGLASLARIISVHDFTVQSALIEGINSENLEKAEGDLYLVLQTKTYRSKANAPKEEGEEGDKKTDKDDKKGDEK